MKINAPKDIILDNATASHNLKAINSEAIIVSDHSKRIFLRKKFSKLALFATALLSGAFGSFIIFHSFAAPNSNNSYTDKSPPFNTYEGELEILHRDDFANKKSTLEYTLVTSEGMRVPLDFPPGTTPPPTKARLETKGIIKNGRLTLSKPTDYQVTQFAPPSETPHKTAVLLFNFRDNPYSSITPEQAKGMVFSDPDSANSYFKENSYGKLTLTGAEAPNGSVFGYYTIDEDDVQCRFDAWALAADAAAMGSGFDPANYDNIIYVSPANSCGRALGLAYLGGSKSFIFGASAREVNAVIKHELGHNFGAFHANSLSCRDTANKPVVISDNCTENEYGDPFDIMGDNIFDSITPHTNNYYKDRLGWLPEGEVQTIYESGDYIISPQELPGSGIKALRLIRQIDARNKYQYYYLEFRQPFGFDSFWVKDPVVNGVSIRVTDEPPGTRIMSRLLDMHPGTGSFGDAPLALNETFSDPAHSLSVKLLGTSPQGAKVHIEVENVPQPDTTPPSIPKNLRTVEVASRIIEIEWEGSPEDDADRYLIYRNGQKIGEVPVRVRSTFTDIHRFSVGQKVTYTVRVVDFVGNISDPSVPLKVTIPPKDTQPPTAPSGLTVVRFRDSLQLDWNPASDNKGVMGYLIIRTSNNTGKKKERKVFDLNARGCERSPKPTCGKQYFDIPPTGSYSYTVRAYDTDGNKSPKSNTVNVRYP